jgi:hypothetical protein
VVRAIGLSNLYATTQDAYGALSPDTTGKHWLLSTMNGGVSCGSNLNGWIDGGELVPLAAGCTVVAEAW